MGSSQSKPLVSIIMPAHDSERFVSEAIRSVVSQIYSNWEMIVIDDASKDRTGEIVKSWVNVDSRIRCVRLSENVGVANARNVAVSHVNGEYVTFLDSDDLWLPEKLSTQVAYMQRTGAAICCSQYRRIAADGSKIGKLIEVPARIDYQSLLKENTIGFLTAMIDRKQSGEIRFARVGHEDYVLWLSLLKRGIVAHGLQSDLARYRVSDNSLSARKSRAAQWMWNIYRNIEKLSLLASVWYFAHYALRGYFKHKEL